MLDLLCAICYYVRTKKRGRVQNPVAYLCELPAAKKDRTEDAL